MSDVEIPQVDPAAPTTPPNDAPIIHPKAAPIESRFLFVDVRPFARSSFAAAPVPVSTRPMKPSRSSRP